MIGVMEPIIKVRYKEKVLITFLLVLAQTNAILPRCDKTPHDQGVSKISGDNGFTIQVSGAPRKYRQNQVYTIQLSVRFFDIYTIFFNTFFLFLLHHTIPVNFWLILQSFLLITNYFSHFETIFAQLRIRIFSIYESFFVILRIEKSLESFSLIFPSFRQKMLKVKGVKGQVFKLAMIEK